MKQTIKWESEWILPINKCVQINKGRMPLIHRFTLWCLCFSYLILPVGLKILCSVSFGLLVVSISRKELTKLLAVEPFNKLHYAGQNIHVGQHLLPILGFFVFLSFSVYGKTKSCHTSDLNNKGTIKVYNFTWYHVAAVVQMCVDSFTQM